MNQENLTISVGLLIAGMLYILFIIFNLWEVI